MYRIIHPRINLVPLKGACSSRARCFLFEDWFIRKLSILNKTYSKTMLKINVLFSKCLIFWKYYWKKKRFRVLILKIKFLTQFFWGAPCNATRKKLSFQIFYFIFNFWENPKLYFFLEICLPISTKNIVETRFE